MKQVYNPYLPLYEYVPDGEPRNFGGRVYIYGSHDVPGGTRYCEGDYVTWSAPEDDLSDWRYEGVIYRRTDDPSNKDDRMQLWAPDVTRGPDGRYYLYYCYSFYPEIGVAVSDSPAGPFTFYGHVHYPADIRGGAEVKEYMPFDPAVLTDSDGRVYLYYGFAPAAEKEMRIDPEMAEKMKELTIRLPEFGEDGMVVELEPDMLTTKGEPRPLIPGGHHTAGTGFEGHGFFEASSIRRVGDKYYFVYSSHKSHELCYAVSDRPDAGFAYGGTIVSNGDIGLDGRDKPVNTLGNNHGGMVEADGKWYIFYHRQTNGTEFSRQGCAEPIEIAPDGSIRQVEITSCGLNGGPLKGEGAYPAAIACHITCGTTLDYIDYNDPVMKRQTRITAEPDGDGKTEQYVTGIEAGSRLGYKYFAFAGAKTLTLTVRGDFDGTVSVSGDEQGKKALGGGGLAVHSGGWTEVSFPLSAAGKTALYLAFDGEGTLDLKTLAFC